jgi:hypothetical protein
VRRLRPLDAVLLAVLVPLWLVCFVLYVNEAVRGRLARVPVYVWAPENAEGYPTVRGFRLGTEVETSGLVVDDRLLRVGKADLRGVGPFGFVARAYEEASPDLRVLVTFERAGERGETSLRLVPIAYWGTLPVTLGSVIAGVLAILCEPGSRPARVFFLASLAFSFHWTRFVGGPRLQTYAWIAVYLLSALVMFPFILRTAMIFPEKLTLAGTRTPVWPWFFAVYAPIASGWVFGVPLPPVIAARAGFIVHVALMIALLVLLTRNFRRANPLGRRQLKWMVYGSYVGIAPVLAANVAITLNPSLWWLHEASMIAVLLMPICICIAILRANFFDIDRLISATATFSILVILLMGGIVFGFPRLVWAVSTAVGADPTYGSLIFSLVVVLTLVLGRYLLHPRIERMLFPAHHALEQGVTLLLQELPACNRPQALLTLVGERLSTLWQPECCVVYGRLNATYVPIFVRGSAVPPVFETHSPLVGALQTRLAPLEVDRWRRTASVFLGPSDWAALDSLRAAVVLPVSQGNLLVSFVCLGPKSSGDVYTPTDFTWLSTIADKISEILRRFDTREIEHQVGVIKEALRREVL